MAAAATTPALTKLQAAQLVRAYRQQHTAEADGWIRARNHGERVTLASLYYRHLLTRRAHSGAGTTSPAYEYKLPSSLYTAMYGRAQQRKFASGDVGVYRGVDTDGNPATPEGALAKTDSSGNVVTAFKGGGGAAGGKRGSSRTTTRGGSMAEAVATPPAEGDAPAAAAGAAAPAAATKKTRVEKTHKDAKAARKEMEKHAEGYKAYCKAQADKATAVKAGNQTGEKKAQKAMDANRAAYTAHRAAYRKYQAAPEK